MKKAMIGFVSGALLFGGISAYAANSSMIEVFYAVKDIKIDQVSQMPEGNQQPFVYQGTTFVPLRYVAEALGESVEWDSKTQTIHIGETEKENEVYLGKGIQSMNFQRSSYGGFEVIYDREEYEYGGSDPDANGIDNVGNRYDNYMTLYSYDWAYVEFPLNGQYKQFKATFGLDDEYKNISKKGVFEIYVDDQLVDTYPVEAGLFPKDIAVDVKNANKIRFKLVLDENDGHLIEVGLFNGRFIK